MTNFASSTIFGNHKLEIKHEHINCVFKDLTYTILVLRISEKGDTNHDFTWYPFIFVIEYPENITVTDPDNADIAGTYNLDGKSVGSMADSFGPVWTKNDTKEHHLLRTSQSGLWSIVEKGVSDTVVATSLNVSFTPIADIWSGKLKGSTDSGLYGFEF